MTIRKKEVVALALIVVALCVAGFAYLGASSTLPEQEQQFQKSVNQTFQIGDTLVLDSKQDESATFNGNTYAAKFEWNGTMEVTVESAELAPPPDNPQYAIPVVEDYIPLTCKIRIKNIDGKSKSPIQSDLPYRFFITSVFLPDISDLSCELVYFDGTPTDAPEKQAYTFDLKPGEEKTYTVCYAIPLVAQELLGYQGNLYLYAGIGNTDKYRVDLGIPVNDLTREKEVPK